MCLLLANVGTYALYLRTVPTHCAMFCTHLLWAVLHCVCCGLLYTADGNFDGVPGAEFVCGARRWQVPTLLTRAASASERRRQEIEQRGRVVDATLPTFFV